MGLGRVNEMNNIEKFAKACGVRIVRCRSREWGGSYGYALEDHPNTNFLGYKDKNSAYHHWMHETFGDKASKALINILNKDDER
jgi:hypothetical protein